MRIIVEVPIGKDKWETENGVTRGPIMSTHAIANQLRALADKFDATVFEEGESVSSADGGIVYWNPESRPLP